MRETIRRLHRELNLTILLSSHLLNEVEQVCNRICVLHQGRKVFEGTLAEATQTRNWVRLVTGNFAAAVARLQPAGLITSSSEGKFITLAENVGTDQIVRVLVEAGLPVFEIAREERTLESFYLNLMQEKIPPRKKRKAPPTNRIMFLFQLRSDLWKLFGKKRTYIGFLIFLIGQMTIVLLFRYGAGPARQMTRLLEMNGYVAKDFITSLTVATTMLFPIAYLLLPLYVSLVGGDLLAKEAEDGTLRMILSRPVSAPADTGPEMGGGIAVRLFAGNGAGNHRAGVRVLFLPVRRFVCVRSGRGFQHFGFGVRLEILRAVAFAYVPESRQHHGTGVHVFVF